MISNELRELIEQMLDKNPETRITVPEIKVTVKNEKTEEKKRVFVNYQSVSPDHDV